MKTQNGGRPTILPKMYEEPLFSQIIDKIESGCNDREIYTSLHCSAKTFRKWRDDNIKAYDEAKGIVNGDEKIYKKVVPMILKIRESSEKNDVK